MLTSNIELLRKNGFSVEVTPQDIAVGCTLVKHSEIFWFFRKSTNSEDFSLSVPYGNPKSGYQLVIAGDYTASTMLPFVILDREGYSKVNALQKASKEAKLALDLQQGVYTKARSELCEWIGSAVQS